MLFVMEPIPYSHSDSEGEYPSRTESEDNVKNLINISVEREISRGNQLRFEKVKPPVHPRGLDIVNIEVLKPMCTDQKRQYRKESPNKFKGFKRCPNSPSVTPFTRPNSPTTRNFGPVQESKPYSSMKSKSQRCPLRITELAVPSKRQCIETWRARCHTLPGYMVDRLKRQVMDQTPVVGINDALNSFKKRKSEPVKRPCKKMSTVNDEHMKEIKGLCGVFGMQISKILMIPMCITLNPRLEKLSEIIAGDMNQLIKTSKRFEMVKSMYNKILTEMSSKVAVWIVNILEEASYKLLEDDLRVQRNTYRRLGKEDKLVTLIEKTFGQGVMSDLEEEEGPVLDFIDDLVENVVSFCEPAMDIDEIYGSSPDGSGSWHEHKLMNEEKSIASPESTEKDFDSYSSDQNYTTVDDTGESLTQYKSALEHELRDSPTTQSLNTNELQSVTEDKLKTKLEEVEDEHLSENIRGEIMYILDMIVNNGIYDDEEDDINQEVDDDEKYEDTHDLQTMTSYQLKDAIDAIQKDFVNETIHENEDNIEIDIPKLFETDTTLEDKVESVDNVEQNNDNVSEIFEIFSEEFTDDKNKKVKFSTNMVSPKEYAQIGNSNDPRVENHTKISEQISWIPSNEYFMPDVLFGPPNQDLLCNADELWPQDFITPMLKATESISKSITSLGRILESDETAFASPDISNFNIVSDADGKAFESNRNKKFNDLPDYSTAVKIDINGIELKSKTAESELIIDNTAKDNKDIPNMADINNSVNIVPKPKSADGEIYKNETVRCSIDESFTAADLKNTLCDTANLKEDIVEKFDSNQDLQSSTIYDNDIHDYEFIDMNILQDTKDEQTEYETNKTPSIAGYLISVNSNTFDDKLETALKKLSTEEQHFSVEKSQSYENIVLGVVQDKVKLSRVLTEVKLSYKVHPNSAPSWVSRDHGEPSDDSFYSEANDNINLQELNHSQRCKDLEQGFKNIEMWNNWISDMCHNIMYVQSRNGLAIPQKIKVNHWLQLKKNIDKDAILWRKLYQRGYDRLKIYKNSAMKSQTSISCGDNRSITESEMSSDYTNILDRIHSFDRLCLLMHRQIVSTEYCVCNCKRNYNTKSKGLELVSSNNRR